MPFPSRKTLISDCTRAIYYDKDAEKPRSSVSDGISIEEDEQACSEPVLPSTQHHMKIPTSYSSILHHRTYSTCQPGPNRGLLDIFFFYEVSALNAEFEEYRTWWTMRLRWRCLYVWLWACWIPDCSSGRIGVIHCLKDRWLIYCSKVGQPGPLEQKMTEIGYLHRISLMNWSCC